MARGRPGRLTMSERPRMPAVWRERIAVGTLARLTCRINSPKPGIGFSTTSPVASGVTSRGAGPVPPVVTIRQQPSLSASSISVSAMPLRSSGMTRATGVQGVARTFAK